jgi:hypothetical protein
VLLDDINLQARDAGAPLVGDISTESDHFSDGEWSVPMGVVSNSTPSRISTICPPGSLLLSGLRHPLRGYGMVRTRTGSGARRIVPSVGTGRVADCRSRPCERISTAEEDVPNLQTNGGFDSKNSHSA